MSQVSGPVIAVGLVLSAVFVPCAFISGITGQFFRQFALTIAASTIISTFNSLTLSPALAAVLLRPRGKAGHEVLPELLYVAVGGWLAWRMLTPWLARVDRKLHDHCRRGIVLHLVAGGPLDGGGRGRGHRLACWRLAAELRSWPGLSRRSMPASAWPPRAYTRAVGMTAARQRAGAGRLRRPAVP